MLSLLVVSALASGIPHLTTPEELDRMIRQAQSANGPVPDFEAPVIVRKVFHKTKKSDEANQWWGLKEIHDTVTLPTVPTEAWRPVYPPMTEINRPAKFAPIDRKSRRPRPTVEYKNSPHWRRELHTRQWRRNEFGTPFVRPEPLDFPSRDKILGDFTWKLNQQEEPVIPRKVYLNAGQTIDKTESPHWRRELHTRHWRRNNELDFPWMSNQEEEPVIPRKVYLNTKEEPVIPRKVYLNTKEEEPVIPRKVYLNTRDEPSRSFVTNRQTIDKTKSPHWRRELHTRHWRRNNELDFPWMSNQEEESVIPRKVYLNAKEDEPVIPRKVYMNVREDHPPAKKSFAKSLQGAISWLWRGRSHKKAPVAKNSVEATVTNATDVSTPKETPRKEAALKRIFRTLKDRLLFWRKKRVAEKKNGDEIVPRKVYLMAEQNRIGEQFKKDVRPEYWRTKDVTLDKSRLFRSY